MHGQGLGRGGDENQEGNNGEHREDHEKDNDKVLDDVPTSIHLLRVPSITVHEIRRQQTIRTRLLPLRRDHQPELRTDNDWPSHCWYIRCCDVSSCGHIYRHVGFTRLRAAFEFEERFEDDSFVR